VVNVACDMEICRRTQRTTDKWDSAPLKEVVSVLEQFPPNQFCFAPPTCGYRTPFGGNDVETWFMLGMKVNYANL
jgi:hypothetical protein